MKFFRRNSSISCLVVAAAVLVGCSPAGSTDTADTGSDAAVMAWNVSYFETPAGAGSAEVNLFGDQNGVLMSWLEPSDFGHALRMAELDGDGWRAERTVFVRDDLFANWADFPSVTRLHDDRLVAHWLQRSGDGTYAYDVVLATSADDGATWSEPWRPHDDGTQTEHGFVSVVPELDGGFTVVWLDGRDYAEAGPAGHGEGGAEMAIRARRYLGDGTAEPDFVLDARTCDCCQTAAVRAGDGMVVAYRDRSDEEIRDIQVVRRGPDGWSDPVTVGDDRWQISGCPVNGPSLATAQEAVAIAWFSLVEGAPEVKVAFSDDRGSTFGTPVMIERGSETAATLGRVDIEFIDDDTAVVLWLTSAEGTGEIRYRTVSRTGDVGGVELLATTSASRGSGFPRMARTDDGLLFAWRTGDEPETIQAARLHRGPSRSATN